MSIESKQTSQSAQSAQPKRTGRTRISGFGNIPSHRNGFPSPVPIALYEPKSIGEVFSPFHPASEIRGWAREAADYQDVPYELVAVILQQENGPNATEFQKIGQFGERALTTAAAKVDEYLFDAVPDKISGSSSGIANMKRATLREGAAYVGNVLGRKAIPDGVSKRYFFDVDAQIPGNDLKNDFYFLSARLRQLIDRTTGVKDYRGELNREQVRKVAARYNGGGPLADKYGRDAVERLDRAAKNIEPLYFYEMPQ